VYPAPEVAAFIREHFRPVRSHIKEQPVTWKRYQIRWTPTVLILGPDGDEARRIEGFLPADEFLAQLHLGLGFLGANHKDWGTAQRWFDEVVANYPQTAAAPEAMYWAGVARYSASHDATELRKTTQQFKERYQDTVWAKRAIW
jgi:hypothetical protein